MGGFQGSRVDNPEPSGRRGWVLAARLPAGVERRRETQQFLALSPASEAGLLPPYFGILKEAVSSLEPGFPMSILSCLRDACKTPNSAVLDTQLCQECVYCRACRHVSAPINTRPAGGEGSGGPADVPLPHGSKTSAGRAMHEVAGTKPRHMPEPACPKTAPGRPQGRKAKRSASSGGPVLL